MDVTDETFYREVVERSHDLPVVVDFCAEWCGPCRMLTPVLEREVATREGQVLLAKVDVDASPALAAHYRVQGIPAVKAFRNGTVVAEFTGVRSGPGVADFLDSLLGPGPEEQLIEALRESGDEPDVLAALDAADYERALSLLLEEVRTADGDRRDRIRELMVAIFGILGQDHPVSTSYRRQLATELY